MTGKSLNIAENYFGRLVSLTLLFLLLFLVSCQNKQQSEKKVQSKDTPQEQKYLSKYKFGLITSVGKLGDKSFKDMLYKGMLLAQKKFNINYEFESPGSKDEFTQILDDFIKKGCNVIFCTSFDFVNYVDTYAVKYPEIKFILIDTFAKNYHPNVASITFKQNEGSFLVGALGALMTKSGNIGVIGAANYQVINDFFIGYEAGARYITNDIKIYSEYISDYNRKQNPWEDPKTAKVIAIRMATKKNIDMIYGVAAASNLGIFNGCKEAGIYAFGVDIDQDYLEQGTILSSMLKRLDKSLVFLIGKILDEKFENKKYVLGLKEAGVSLSEMLYTKHLIGEDNLNKLKEIEKKILDKTIVVPTVY